jgi:hypothetical protein
MTSTILKKNARVSFQSILGKIRQHNVRKRRRIEYKKMLKKVDIKDRFSAIYENKLWKSQESRSGEGSEIEYTKPLRDWLVKNLPKLDVKVFVDAPCGDFNWMRLVLPKMDFQYIGIDIVPSVISENIQLYANDRISFKVANICEDKLPNCDLIMVRDCLFHLSFEDINKFLLNLDSVDYKYLLTSTHMTEKNFSNKDIISGDFRLIDLFSAPFHFDKSKVVEYISDNPKGYKTQRKMVLIEKVNVPKKCI